MPRLHHEDIDSYKASQVTLIHREGRELRLQTWPDVEHIRSDWGCHLWPQFPTIFSVLTKTK